MHKEKNEINACLNILKWILVAIGFTEVSEVIYAKLKNKESRLVRRSHGISFRYRLVLNIGEKKKWFTYPILQEQNEISGILGKKRL